ncbi:AraC family transcriptional regulator [Vibrio astriarenae]|uniref:AraC family transcriptional regulator n=1 Tax=Vibrio astriarenae TaxID=1481923 RepID=A0A7Z2T264_9VIBR|nr:AraC family transcriptional regulator [Vibrio astriarenae]QIA63009.1 AraC family transcriptional regulator [Vibrio astriarenae]
MNFAIEHTHDTSPYLLITGRKHTLKHRLIIVESGLALVRLGKQEYAVEAGHAFWLPFDCLVSTTYLPNSSITDVTISARVSGRFSKQAGFVTLSPMLKATIAQLRGNNSEEYSQTLKQVIKHECMTLKPSPTLSPLSETLSQWSPTTSGLEKEIHLGLLVREARKMKLSGKSDELIANALFGGQVAQFHALYQALIES